MKNPYDKIEAHPSEVSFGGWQRFSVIALFIGAIISVPVERFISEFKKDRESRWIPIVEFWNHPNQKSYNHLFEKKSKSDLVTREEPNLRDHLQSFEAGIKESDFRTKVRESEQALWSTLTGKGNNKVVRGKDGWLYYQAAIDAITGRGPLLAEPDSVTKDPDRPVWQEALPVIENFATQLKDRGVDLMIVPIPVKPMIQTEGLGASGIIKHPDQDEFYTRLREVGINVVDLTVDFEHAKANGDVFLKQDTHWRARTAKMAAERVGKEVEKYPWYQKQEKNFSPTFDQVERSALGDLVEMLGLPTDQKEFYPETEIIEKVLDPQTRQSVEGDLTSPISIIGDSFINIFEEPGLGFSDGLEGMIGGGFSSHLAADLKLRLHTLAINGEGATGVRRMFASLPDNVVRSKKLVIWAIASRDFLLSESAANRAGVYWRDVEFNTESETIEPPVTDDPESGDLILSGVLKEKSAIQDPTKTAYSEAIYSTIFEGIKVESGEYYDKEAYVFLWAFRDRKFLPSANLQPGKRYRLKLIHMNERPELSRKTQLDDLIRFDLDRLFAIEIE
ncbi:MAG: hypothetical protein P1U89_10595 [Verrucomicrobiales bacterium]|nr:hypothetical protein [Verrucomicrobiales bacterium]